jgi:hypothetical protein
LYTSSPNVLTRRGTAGPKDASVLDGSSLHGPSDLTQTRFLKCLLQRDQAGVIILLRSTDIDWVSKTSNTLGLSIVKLPHSNVAVIATNSELASTILNAPAISDAASAGAAWLPQLPCHAMQHPRHAVFGWVASLILVFISFCWRVLSAPILFWLYGVFLMFKLFIYLSKLVDVLVCGIVPYLLVSVTFSILSIFVVISAVLRALCYFSVGVIVVLYALLLLDLQFTLIFHSGTTTIIPV